MKFKAAKKSLIPSAEEFAAAQKALMARGAPEDPCADCGEPRKYHLPPRVYSFAKTGGSSGNSHNVHVLAPTCCHSPNGFFSCVAFREKDDPPVRGQWNPMYAIQTKPEVFTLFREE
jgi:hypothetical protein